MAWECVCVFQTTLSSSKSNLTDPPALQRIAAEERNQVLPGRNVRTRLEDALGPPPEDALAHVGRHEGGRAARAAAPARAAAAPVGVELGDVPGKKYYLTRQVLGA